MNKCPACDKPDAPVPGYFHPSGDRSRVVRCEVCKGSGLVTVMQIIGWELSQ